MFRNILELIEKLKTEQDCINFLIEMRWNGKPKCPYHDCKANEFDCDDCKVYEFSDGKRFQCSCCDRIFSYKTKTIFENTKIPLKKWFMAIYLHTAHKKGISSCQLAKDISVTQKTAWFMLHRIREIDNQNNTTDDFGGDDKIVEMDEMYLGGRAENKHKANKVDGNNEKAVVFGMVDRETKQVKTFHVESSEYHVLGQKTLDNVKQGSIIVTDGYQSYERLNRFYTHKSVNHSKGEYVRKENNTARESVKIHTNGIEGYWSQVKRSIYGIYHWVSKKHLQRYLNEMDFRYNTRKIKDNIRFMLFMSNLKGRLKYVNLIAKPNE